MTTQSILLPATAFYETDGSGTINAPANRAMRQSTATQTADTSKLRWPVWEFPKTSNIDTHIQASFPWPSDWVSGFTVRLRVAADVATGDIVWKFALRPVLLNTTDLDNVAFLASANSTAIPVPATIGVYKDVTVSGVTTTGLTAGCEMVIQVGRNADNGGDTAAGIAVLKSAVIEYESA